jgi:hypothetical protein
MPQTAGTDDLNISSVTRVVFAPAAWTTLSLPEMALARRRILAPSSPQATQANGHHVTSETVAIGTVI